MLLTWELKPMVVIVGKTLPVRCDIAMCLYILSFFISVKTIIQDQTQRHNISLPNMAQLGWALLFLLGSWSSVEGLPLPRIASLAWDTLPWATPLPGAEVAELLHGSPPSVKDVPTKIHQGSQGGQDTKRVKGETHRSKGIRGRPGSRTGTESSSSGGESDILGFCFFFVSKRWQKVNKGAQRSTVCYGLRLHSRKKSKTHHRGEVKKEEL